MKQKKILVTAAVVFCSIFFMIAQADAQVAKGKNGKGQGFGSGQGCGAQLPLNLNLTQDQTAKINTFHSQFFTETTDLRSNLFKSQEELKALLLEQTPDIEKAKKIQGEISALESQLDMKRLEYQFEARKVLTPEQLAQLPPGCTMGFSPMGGVKGCGFRGGRGQGPGCNIMSW